MIRSEGLDAWYTPAELDFVRRLNRKSKTEVAFLHTAKALFDGRMRD